ncbi:MAG TPA: DUF5996 family protein [Acidimicrobiales bacterium]|jgi:hypothetical protein
MTTPRLAADRSGPWPELALSGWGDTRDTLHMWLQIVGKVRMQLTPLVNHWWNVPLYVSSRGLTTSLMPTDRGGLEIEFDFIDHVLQLRTTEGDVRHVPLEPQSVATFYRSTMAALDGLGIDVRIRTLPSEVDEAIPFDQDERHDAYDRGAVHRYWLTLVEVDRVLTEFRARFMGKASPVHLFWGGADLCTSRFSGRPAPKHRGGVPNCPDWVQVLAYSHEVSSAGFWPGAEEPMFYAYAYPEPAGFADWSVEPAEARYDPQLGEFVLPYSAVQTAADPDATLLAFLQSTYEAAAELSHWDRTTLEWAPTVDHRR